MNAFLKQQMAAMRASLEDRAQHLIITALLALVAVTSLIGCVVFASIAAYAWLASVAGAVMAALVLAALYLVIVLACVLAIWTNGAARRSRGKAATDGSLQNNAKIAAADATAASSPAPADSIDQTLAPIIAILQQAGLQDANAAVLVAAALAKQVPPFVLVAAAFASGLAFGRR
jgi:uncharacterized membrane protein